MGHSERIIIKNEKFKGLKEATNDNTKKKMGQKLVEEGTEPRPNKKKDEILHEFDACPRGR